MLIERQYCAAYEKADAICKVMEILLHAVTCIDNHSLVGN